MNTSFPRGDTRLGCGDNLYASGYYYHPWVSRWVAALRRMVLLLVLAAGVSAARAATVQQTFTLKPGWNSVWLRVDPTNPDPASVFAGLPVEQAWCWFPTDKTVQFISDPNNGLFNVPGWSVYIPATQPTAFLTNLGAVQGQRAYLIKISGAVNVTLKVLGSATVRPLKWRADSFNLFGFDVDPSVGGGAAGAVFTGVPELDGQLMYRLDAPTGTWQVVPSSYTIRAGEAYWVFSKGNATFDGLLTAEPGNLNFGPAETEKLVTITNNTAFTVNLTVANINNLPLVYDAGTSTALPGWTALTSLPKTLAAGASVQIRFGARRTGLTVAPSGTVVISGGGATVNLPASIALPPAVASGGGMTGLWVGTATLSKVVDVNGNLNTPVPTAATLDLRVLIHVNGSGQASLLKQVTLMRKNVPAGTTSPPVLVTDDTRLADFKGAAERDGKDFGQRISAIGFDFAGTSVPLSGAFGSSLAGVVSVPRTLPTNPFKHEYHPDHDDLDGQFKPIPNPFPAGTTPDQQEVWDVTRNIQLTFDPPATDKAPTSGSFNRTGTYRETVSGLHKNSLIVEGSFQLRRVNTVDQLNPAP